LVVVAHAVHVHVGGPKYLGTLASHLIRMGAWLTNTLLPTL